MVHREHRQGSFRTGKTTQSKDSQVKKILDEQSENKIKEEKNRWDYDTKWRKKRNENESRNKNERT